MKETKLEDILGLNPDKLNINQCQTLCIKNNIENFHVHGPKATLKAKWLDVHMGLFEFEGGEGCIMMKLFEFVNDIHFSLGEN